MVASDDLGTEQTKGTQNTAKKATHLLDYCATYPDSFLRYRASDMKLYVDSDASYLSAPKARSRVVGHFYLGDKLNEGKTVPDGPVMGNGAIYNEVSILRNVMSSAAETEIAALFKNCKTALVLHNTLEDMGYPQHKTPIVTDNITAKNIIHSTVKQKRTKMMDMRFYCIRDKKNENRFTIWWMFRGMILA